MGGRRTGPPSDRERGAAVLKTMWPDQPGAIKLARRFGDALVCVRYRRSANGRMRITTVELAVEVTPVRRRWVAVRLPWGADAGLREQLQACGAEWDPRQRVWIMPRRAAEALGLEAEIDMRTR